MSFLDTVHRVIDLAREVSRFNENELPKYYRNYPFISPGEDNPPRPPAEGKLEKYLKTQPDDVIHALSNFMYVGRGDKSVDDMLDGPDRQKDTFSSKNSAIKHMMAQVPLAEYLEDGLARVTTAGVDLNHWEPEGTHSRS